MKFFVIIGIQKEVKRTAFSFFRRTSIMQKKPSSNMFGWKIDVSYFFFCCLFFPDSFSAGTRDKCYLVLVLMGCMIFVSFFLDDIRISIPTISLLTRLKIFACRMLSSMIICQSAYQ